MRIILDRISPRLRHAALQCVDRYHIEYMFDGRKPGLRGGVRFSAHPDTALVVYHTKTGNIVVFPSGS